MRKDGACVSRGGVCIGVMRLLLMTTLLSSVRLSERGTLPMIYIQEGGVQCEGNVKAGGEDFLTFLHSKAIPKKTAADGGVFISDHGFLPIPRFVR